MDHASAPSPATAPAAALALAVEAGGHGLALPAADVAEVVRPRPLARVPHAPPALLGVAQLRGAVVPVLSLARLRGGDGGAAPPAGRDAERLVVLARRPPAALLVDRVAGLGPAGDAVPVDFDALVARAFPAPNRREPRAPGPHGQPAPAEAAPAEAGDARAERAFLLFNVAGQLCGLPLADVAEVARAPGEIVPVPDGPPGTLGVIERRGALMPLASARVLLGRPSAGTEVGAVVVVGRHAGGIGLAVDAIDGLVRLPAGRVEAVPAALSRGAANRVAEIGRLEDGRLVSVLAARSLVEGAMMGARMDAMMGADAGREAADGMEEIADGERFVVFQVGDEHYALPIAAVEEVVRRPDTLARVPRAPASVAGAMTLRGAVVPVVEAAARFGAEPSGAAGRRRVIVLRDGAARAGLSVDAVSEVLLARPEAVQPAPALAADAAGTFDRVIADRGRLILVARPSALLSEVGAPRVGARREAGEP